VQGSFELSFFFTPQTFHTHFHKKKLHLFWVLNRPKIICQVKEFLYKDPVLDHKEIKQEKGSFSYFTLWWII